jgi:hypothetical protein
MGKRTSKAARVYRVTIRGIAVTGKRFSGGAAYNRACTFGREWAMRGERVIIARNNGPAGAFQTVKTWEVK